MKIRKGSIQLSGMRFYAYHGVFPEEREKGNEFVVDFSCPYDFSKALYSDNLEDTLNYASIYNIIASEMSQTSNLLEHVAGRIASALMASFPELKHFSLRISKLNPPLEGPTASSSISIEI